MQYHKIQMSSQPTFFAMKRLQVVEIKFSLFFFESNPIWMPFFSDILLTPINFIWKHLQVLFSSICGTCRLILTAYFWIPHQTLSLYTGLHKLHEILCTQSCSRCTAMHVGHRLCKRADMHIPNNNMIQW